MQALEFSKVNQKRGKSVAKVVVRATGCGFAHIGLRPFGGV